MTQTTTVRLESRGLDVCLGKPLATRGPAPDAFRMSDIMKALPNSVIEKVVSGNLPPGLPNVPNSGWGWGYAFGTNNWGMVGNGPAPADSNLPQGSVARDQGAGDCWWAMFLHRLRLWAKLAGRPIPQVSDLTLLTQYAAYVASFNNGQGYDIQTGNNDLGTDPLGAYEYLATNPFKDDAGNTYPVSKPISIAPGNVTEHLVATKLFMGVGVGVQLQQAQVDQFDQGKPLAYVAGSPVVGGHELFQPGPNGMVEWGERIQFDPSFITKCNDQSEAVFSAEMFNAATGQTVTHESELDVEKYAAAFAAQLS